MSGENYYSDNLDDNGFEGQETGKGLRAQLEQALGEIRSLREGLDKERRGKTVESLLKEKGIDPAVSAMIPKDADPQQWVDTYGKFLGVKTQEQSREGDVAQERTPEVEVHDAALEEERQALETLQEYGPDTGIPSTASADVIEKMKSFETEADLLKYISSGGVES